ncbi:hypothetical protein FRC08_018385 [Ceratobasidium sp. 394]|nr:hypothetical protein FRC08_018385 [Ceratobasidium sp. 394]KAG9093399.1 hypothetical protein FS749_014448 [Ceratobasidium sp. UAMH 11750]
MHAFFKLALSAILALCLLASVSAAPIKNCPKGTKGKRTGWATYYDVEEGTGACLWDNKNSEHVFAIGGLKRSACGKNATVTYKHKTVRVMVVDECPVCGHNNIDLSPSAFEELAPKRIGKLNGVVWKFD